MTFFFSALLSVVSVFGAVNVTTSKLPGGIFPGIPRCGVGPADTRDLFQVFIRSDDSMVRAFRVSLTYEYDGQRYTVQHFGVDTGEGNLPQALVMFPLPDVAAAKILSLTVAELKDSSSVEIVQ